MIPLRDDNPTQSPPIVLCGLAFVWQFFLAPRGAQGAAFSLGLIPAVLFGSAELPSELRMVPAPLTLFTSMFLHGGILHLGGNMLYLWIFGDNIEDRMGPARFVAFYLICGLAAAFAQAIPSPGSQIPVIGASGAVSGVLGAYLLLYPHARVLVALPLIIVFYTFYMPALAVLGIWFVGQLLSSLGQTAGEAGIAFRAHIGGFVAGLVLVHFFVRKRPRRRRR